MPIPIIAGLGAGAIISAGSQIANAASGLFSSLPQLEEEVDCTIWGNSRAVTSKAEMYEMAMSVCFGQLKRRDFLEILPPTGMIGIEYDLEGNSVRCVVRQQTGYVANAIAQKKANPPPPLQVFAGPPSEYVGGEFQWGSKLPGLPGNTTRGNQLSHTGVTILTPKAIHTGKLNPNLPAGGGNFNHTKPSDNPHPPGDDVSRGWPTISSDPVLRAVTGTAFNPEYILYAALSPPCSTAGMLYNLNEGYAPPVAGVGTSYIAPIPPPSPTVSGGAAPTTPGGTSLGNVGSFTVNPSEIRP